MTAVAPHRMGWLQPLQCGPRVLFPQSLCPRPFSSNPVPGKRTNVDWGVGQEYERGSIPVASGKMI